MHLGTFAKTAPAFYRSGTAMEIVSGPGVGKSSIMREIAAMMSKALGKPFALVTHILSQMDPIDIKGFCIPIKNPEDSAEVFARFTKPTVFPAWYNCEVFVDGKLTPWEGKLPSHGILFLDEFGQATNEAQKVSAQLLLDKKIGEYKLEDGWVVWCASNRMKDKSGVVKRLSFVQNRAKTISIDPLYEPWEAWANKNDIHPLTITFAKRYPAQVFKDSVPTEPGAFCTPRSLVLCTQDLMAMRENHHGEMRLPDDEVAMEVIQGWLGEGAAVDYISHIRLANDLPDIEQVAAKPKDTKVPERVDARFVMANMLAHHCTKKNAKAFMQYMSRMDVEMQVLFVTAISHRDPMMLVMEEVSDWIGDNQDLLLAANQA